MPAPDATLQAGLAEARQAVAKAEAEILAALQRLEEQTSLTASAIELLSAGYQHLEAQRARKVLTGVRVVVEL